jgi:hypothetical protein
MARLCSTGTLDRHWWSSVARKTIRGLPREVDEQKKYKTEDCVVEKLHILRFITYDENKEILCSGAPEIHSTGLPSCLLHV